MRRASALDVSILVVDDDGVILDLIAEQLEEHGYSASTANGVEAALRIVAESPPSIVLTDVCMSQRDGYALLEAMRARFPEIPVILMSSFAPPGVAEQAAERGAAGFLRKPFTEQQIVATIAGALRRRRTPLDREVGAEPQ